MWYDHPCVLLLLSLGPLVGDVTSAVSAPRTRLWAPTYYIAAEVQRRADLASWVVLTNGERKCVWILGPALIGC